jgi:hypothetical protein
MTKRDPHSDNQLIDRLQEEGGAPSQGGSAGGQVARDVGTRSELQNTPGATGTERPRAQDHPEAMNEAKGDKTRARLAPDGDN